MQDQSSDFTPIRDKRIATEFTQIERREDLKQFKITDYTTDLGLIVHVQVPLTLVNTATNGLSFDCFDDKSEDEGSLLSEPTAELPVRGEKLKAPVKVEELKEHFQFEILLDSKYPFSQPQIFCQTKFTNVVDLYDGRDLYQEVLNGEEWRVARNLHELIGALPEFIEQMKIAEDQALEQHEIDEASSLINDGNLPQKSTILTEVFGKYHLESIYDLSHFFDTKDQSSQIVKGKYSKTCKVFKCQEQDDMDPQNEFHEMYAIVTNTCLLVLSPVRGTQFLAQLEFWATL